MINLMNEVFFMQFFVLSITVLVFFTSVIIFGYFGKRSDAKKRRIDYIKEIGGRDNNPELQRSFFDRYIKKILKRSTALMAKGTPKNKIQKNKAKDQLIEKQLRLSGVFVSVQEFTSIKTTFMIATCIIFSLLALILPYQLNSKMMIMLVGIMIGVAGPTFFLRFKVKGHQQKIRDQLPDAMDLLGVCIEAGLSFDIALIKVAEKLSGPFIDELVIAHREIQMGRTRRDALQNMANCTTIAELKTFVSALAQAEQLGIPIINVMRIQSAQLRQTRKQLAQEKGMKAPVKILIPMVFFIFPVLFIILLGPTAINVIKQFSSGGGL
jgi:tight adherence protein C